MTEARASLIPHYIKAASPIGLRRLMLSNNIKLGAYVKYFDINFVNEKGKSYWIAWYYQDINLYTDKALIGGEE